MSGKKRTAGALAVIPVMVLLCLPATGCRLGIAGRRIPRAAQSTAQVRFESFPADAVLTEREIGYLGTTPMTYRFRWVRQRDSGSLILDRHPVTVTASAPDYKPKTVTLHVYPQTTSGVFFDLEPVDMTWQTAVDVFAEPMGSRISINRQFVGTSPLHTMLTWSTGEERTAELRVSQEGYYDAVRVLRPEDKRVLITLLPAAEPERAEE